jgi:hypothetical protein
LKKIINKIQNDPALFIHIVIKKGETPSLLNRHAESVPFGHRWQAEGQGLHR